MHAAGNRQRCYAGLDIEEPQGVSRQYGTDEKGTAMLSANEQNVVVVDVKIPFGSMVVLLVKSTLAAIPAIIILAIIAGIVVAVFGGLFAGLGSVK
jgi:hypothetical protein